MIYIGKDLPDEYSRSKDTSRLKGGFAKAKANAAQGIPELIEEGINGMLFESKNATDLKEKIKKMFASSFDYEELAKKSQQRYSADAYYEKLMEIYSKL